MALNPVERRLVQLLNHWQAFLEQPDKRLLVWQARDNATRLLQCFFEVQKHETQYTAEDVFIVFDAPFEHSIQYARALKEAFAGQYEASREGLAQQGIGADWNIALDDVPHTARGFVDTLASFISNHGQINGCVVAVLKPQNIENEDAYNAWLLRCLETNLPASARIVVLDSLEHPRLSKLIESKHALVWVDALPLDALTIAQETFAQEGGVGPAALFRNHFIGLVTLVEKGTADQVITKARDALAFARAQQWNEQEAAVTLLVSGALLKEQRFAESIQGYQTARHAATAATAAHHPAGRQLILHTWFGEAGVHFAAGDEVRAAECYDEAAVVAQQIPNLILAIEAFRMSAFCHARGGDSALARERGGLALTLGEQLAPDVRAMTTLPVAAVDLLRVIDAARVKMIEDIKRRQNTRHGQALAAAEEHAAALENTDDMQALRTVETQLARELEAADETAARELDNVTTAGAADFRETFARARDLLGPDWPLNMPVALPAAASGVTYP